jgi:hypothetical protein
MQLPERFLRMSFEPVRASKAEPAPQPASLGQ